MTALPPPPRREVWALLFVLAWLIGCALGAAYGVVVPVPGVPSS